MESSKKEKLIKRIKRISNENRELKDLLKDVKIEIAQIIVNLEDKLCEKELRELMCEENEVKKSSAP
jgi:hypothetical protein